MDRTRDDEANLRLADSQGVADAEDNAFLLRSCPELMLASDVGESAGPKDLSQLIQRACPQTFGYVLAESY